MNSEPFDPGLLMGPSTRQLLGDLRGALMRLHKALLDGERIGYERVHGRIASSGQFFRLVVSDEWFAWLHPVSEFIVKIDELLGAREPVAASEARELLEEARGLLTPSETGGEFQRRYHETLQLQPSVVMAHAEVAGLLREPAPSEEDR